MFWGSSSGLLIWCGLSGQELNESPAELLLELQRLKEMWDSGFWAEVGRPNRLQPKTQKRTQYRGTRSASCWTGNLAGKDTGTAMERWGWSATSLGWDKTLDRQDFSFPGGKETLRVIFFKFFLTTANWVPSSLLPHHFSSLRRATDSLFNAGESFVPLIQF